MANISDIKDCYGCGVCALACGKKIIDIRLIEDGFYEPYITNPESCSNCGLCVDVCAFKHSDMAQSENIVSTYAAWSNSVQVRRKSTSGGVGFEVGRAALVKGYKICAVKFNPDANRAEHFIASNIDELTETVGSKYIQSYTLNAFRSISRKEKYIVYGTPCQMDSFRRYMKRFRVEDKFILVDFFCHGVPSMLAWEKYSRWAENKVGRIHFASWRNKQTKRNATWTYGIDDEKIGTKVDWKQSYNMIVGGEKGISQVKLTDGDMFLTLFLCNCCLGKQCYSYCKYKRANSSADLRLGDFWGGAYANNTDGVSSVISYSDKGEELLRSSDVQIMKHPLNDVIDGQMANNAIISPVYSKVMQSLKAPSENIKDAYKYIKNYNMKVKFKKLLNNPFLIAIKIFSKLFRIR
jgi:NAD-dependent dihydropyrimidine dehydrogenase PreA subunit